MLDRAGYFDIAQRAMQRFIEDRPSPAHEWAVRVTSGTTEQGPLVVASHFLPPAFERYAGVRAPIVCFGSMCSRLSNAIFIRYAAGERDSRALFLDNADLRPELRSLIAQFSPDSMCGFISFVSRVAEFIDREDAERIVLLRLAGESLTQTQEEYFRTKFPNARITMAYIANEIGQVTADQCPLQARNRYHLEPGVRVEIADPDETGAGDILVTKEIYPGITIEKYRTGDAGRFLEEPCACGESQTLEVLGRVGYDYVKLAGALLRRDEFDRVASAMHIDDYRALASSVIENGSLKGYIELHVYSRFGAGTPDLALQIATDFSKRAFVTPTQTIENLVQKGIFAPLKVSFAPTAFPTGAKEVKIRSLDI